MKCPECGGKRIVRVEEHICHDCNYTLDIWQHNWFERLVIWAAETLVRVVDGCGVAYRGVVGALVGTNKTTQ